MVSSDQHQSRCSSWDVIQRQRYVRKTLDGKTRPEATLAWLQERALALAPPTTLNVASLTGAERKRFMRSTPFRQLP